MPISQGGTVLWFQEEKLPEAGHEMQLTGPASRYPRSTLSRKMSSFQRGQCVPYLGEEVQHWAQIAKE